MADIKNRNGILVRKPEKTGVDVTVICIRGRLIGQASSPEEGLFIIQTIIS